MNSFSGGMILEMLSLLCLLLRKIWKGKSIYYHNYVKAGILLTNQMQFDKGSLESYNIATNAGLKQSNFLTWAGIRSAIPGHLKFLDDNSRKTGVPECQR